MKKALFGVQPFSFAALKTSKPEGLYSSLQESPCMITEKQNYMPFKPNQVRLNMNNLIFFIRNILAFCAWNVFLLALFTLLVGCTGHPAQTTITLKSTPTPLPTPLKKADTLRLSYWDTPGTLNPHLSTSVKDWEVSRVFYEPLATFDKEGQLIPFLALEIPSVENGEVAKDGKSVIWKLKPNVKWSDGEPFTADDVVFTYHYITNPDVRATSKSYYEQIASVEAIDDHTIKVNFKEATPIWAIPFVGVGGMILPKHLFEKYNGANAAKAPANLEPVGTGPYRVLPPGIKPQEIVFLGTQLIKTIKIKLEPNPFFREKSDSRFSSIEIRGGGTANEVARLVLEAAETDYAWNLTPADNLTTLSKKQGQIVANLGNDVEQLELNWTDPNKETADGERSSIKFPHPFFKDSKVRQAFAYAINREAIAKVYGFTAEKTNFILVTPPQYKSDRVFYTFDLTKAAALLDDAGWKDSNNDGIRDKNGVKLVVLYQTYRSQATQETQKIVQKDLTSIGVDVELKVTDGAIFFGDMSNPDHNGRFLADMQDADWISPSPDPGPFFQYWTCSQIPQKANNYSGFNFRRWCDPRYDALYAQSQQELDPEKRQQIFIQMNDLLTEEVVTIPLVRLGQLSGMSNSIEGFDPTPWDSETWNIKDWRRK